MFCFVYIQNVPSQLAAAVVHNDRSICCVHGARPASNCRHNVRRHILAKTVFLAHLRARSCEHVGRLFRNPDASLLGIARVHFYHNTDVSNSPLSNLFNIYCVRKKTVDKVKVRNCF